MRHRRNRRLPDAALTRNERTERLVKRWRGTFGMPRHRQLVVGIIGPDLTASTRQGIIKPTSRGLHA